MNQTRLFTFGCSFTQYKWPSWADMIGLNFEKFYNFGQPGSGIFFMLYQFVFGNEYFKFNKNDTLIFMLSDEARVDIIKNQEWLTTGLVFNSKEIFGERFFNHYSEIHAVESSYIYVYLLKEMLDKIGCKYEIIYAFPPFFENTMDLFDKSIKNIWNKKDNLTSNNIESLTNFSQKVNDNSYSLVNDLTKETYQDGHCTISTHLEYVKKNLSKYYDKKYDSVVMEWESFNIDGKNDNIVEDNFKNIILKNKVMFINGNIKNDFHLN